MSCNGGYMETILETRNLTKKFGRFIAVSELNMAIKRGQIYGLIGKNGAGKTTLMRMIAGLARPTSGEIFINGSANLDKEREKLGSLIETPAFYPHMTGLTNMNVQRILRPGKASVEDLLRLLKIWDARNKLVGQYSLGMKQRLGIALALIGEPALVLLDEPINGLDPAGIHELRETLIKINKEMGVSFIISSHILGELSKLATHFGVVDKGRMVAEFSADSLNEHSRKSLLISVDDLEKAKQVLQKVEAIKVSVQGAKLRVTNYESPAAINAALLNEGVCVSSLNEEGTQLEEYFLSLTDTKS